MKIKRIITLLLCAALLVVLTSCGGNETPETESPAAETEGTGDAEQTGQNENPDDAETSGGTEAGKEIDFDAAYAAYPADTVIMTVNGTDVKWEEFFFFLCNNVSYLKSMYPNDFDMTMEVKDGETVSDMIVSYATEDAISYRALIYGAELMGISLTEEDKAEMEKDYENACQNSGGEEEFLKQLRENSYIYSKELFIYLYGLEYLTSLCYVEMFGENCEKVTDEMVEEQAETDGYLTVKHILRKFPDDSTDTEGRERTLSEAEEILSKLNGYEGEDFAGYFDELMFSESDDSGALATFPDGYLFQDGDMVPEFYEASKALEVGEISELVETTFGYHIIYKLPINFDLSPISYAKEGYTTTLRQLCATNMFNSTLYGWMESLETEKSEEYGKLDLPGIFKEKA